MNFIKSSIFKHRNEDTQQQPKPDSSGILAVWGSPGSGKSVTAVKLAKAIADKKKNVVLLMCDMTAPMLPCVCPTSELECEKSLGSILAAPHVQELLVKHNLITLKKHAHLTILAMKKGENEYTYPPYTEQQAKELLTCLRCIAPYVVVDCGSHIANDILSAVALIEADSVLRLASCDLKAVSYFSGQLALLADGKWDSDKQYLVASDIRPNQAVAQLGNAAFRLPHSQELEEQFLAGDLLTDLTLKDSLAYRKEIKKICGEVFGI